MRISDWLRRLEIGERLARETPAFELWARGAFEQRGGVLDRPLAGALHVGKLLPADRHRDGRVFARARRIGHDRGAAALVAEVIDEDLALALRLAHRRGIAVGLGEAQRLGEAFREILVRVPVVAGIDGHDDIHALAARQHRQAYAPDAGELAADVARGLFEIGRASCRARVCQYV